MANTQLSDAVALRIGLAARALPDTDPKRLMTVLIDALGLPLTEARLAKLRVNRLREALDGEFAEMPSGQLKSAVSLLKGQNIGAEPEPLPEIKPYSEGDMPGSVRIACASNNAGRIDGHFGSCARFLIYQVSAQELRLIDIRSAGSVPDEEDKNVYRAGLINDCQLLYTVSIGGPAAAKVVRAGLHPVKLPDGGEAAEVAGRLQRVIGDRPPPWLAKVMGASARERIRYRQPEVAS